MNEDWGVEVRRSDRLDGNMLEVYDPDVEDGPMAIIPEDVSMELAIKILEFNFHENEEILFSNTHLDDIDRSIKMALLAVVAHNIGLDGVGNRLIADSVLSSGVMENLGL